MCESEEGIPSTKNVIYIESMNKRKGKHKILIYSSSEVALDTKVRAAHGTIAPSRKMVVFETRNQKIHRY